MNRIRKKYRLTPSGDEIYPKRKIFMLLQGWYWRSALLQYPFFLDFHGGDGENALYIRISSFAGGRGKCLICRGEYAEKRL
jgi:hypothetical protein